MEDIENKAHYKSKKILLILLFPVTIWVLLGTFIYFVIYKIDQLAEFLGKYSQFPFIEKHSAQKWHTLNTWLTYSFPVSSPLIAFYILGILFYSVVSAGLRLFFNWRIFLWKKAVFLMDTSLEFLSRAWNWAVPILTQSFQWCKDSLIALRVWSIECVEYINDEIKKLFK